MCKAKRTMSGKEFDVFSNGFVKITKENAQNAKNAIENDRFYNRAYDKTLKGSSAKKFDEYKCTESNNEILSQILSALNTENSTRVSNDDLKDICNNINNHKVEDELKRLNNEKSKIENYKIIELIYKDVKSGKTLLSFASKFCHFYCLHMFRKKDEEIPAIVDSFPIIDSVMRKVIPIYDFLYNSDCNNYSNYKTQSDLYKYRITEYKKINEEIGITKYYENYVTALINISNNISERCHKQVTVTEIEQLLWWFYRGITDDIDGIKDETYPH